MFWSRRPDSNRNYPLDRRITIHERLESNKECERCFSVLPLHYIGLEFGAASRNRTVSPGFSDPCTHQLYESGKDVWCLRKESNLSSLGYQPSALPLSYRGMVFGKEYAAPTPSSVLVSASVLRQLFRQHQSSYPTGPTSFRKRHLAVKTSALLARFPSTILLADVLVSWRPVRDSNPFRNVDSVA